MSNIYRGVCTLLLLTVVTVAHTALSGEIVWFNGLISESAPQGELLSDNPGYWDDSVLTGVRCRYKVQAENGAERDKEAPPIQDGQKLIDGRMGTLGSVTIGARAGERLLVLFDFMRPCIFSEVDVLTSQSGHLDLAIEVADSIQGPWRKVDLGPLQNSQTVTRAILTEAAAGRCLRLSIAADQHGLIGEILVWGAGTVSEQYPEQIAPVWRNKVPAGMLTSSTGMESTAMTAEQFGQWRASIGDHAESKAVFGLADEASPMKPILPDKDSINLRLAMKMVRNETESRYITLTNTSPNESLTIVVDVIELSPVDDESSSAKLEARLLVGGALPTRPPERRLTREQSLRLMADPDNAADGAAQGGGIEILPFFDVDQALDDGMMQRYLSNGAEIMNYPRLTLPPGGAAVFMLRVSSHDASPGRYSGTVSVRDKSGVVAAMELVVAVDDIKLPDLDLWIHTWSSGTGQFPYESQARRRRDVLASRQLGQTVWRGLPEAGSKAQLFGEHGRSYYDIYGLPNYYVHAGYSGALKAEDLSETDEGKIADHIKDIVRHAKTLGLECRDWYVELWDEPQEANADIFGALARIIDRSDSNVQIYMNPLFWRPGFAPQDAICDSLSPYYNELIDISVPIAGLVGDNRTTRELWSSPRAVNAMFIHPPRRGGREMAWDAFDFGFNGWGYYCYYAPRGNPWDIRTWSELDFSYQMVFPGPEGPIITPLYETMRDGWEDYRLLTVLREQGETGTAREMLNKWREARD